MKTTIETTRSEIIFNIEVDDLDSFDRLNALADVYLDLSYQIDENLSDHDVSVEYSTLFYSIDVTTPEGRVDEEAIFSKFVGNSTLESKAANFISNVNMWCRAHGDDRIWQDDENPLAENAAYVLCMQDLKYIPLYVELLLQNDLNHEVYQNDHIEALIEKHGICKPMLTLLAHRVGGACGQWGMNQVEEHQPLLLDYFSAHPEHRALFLETGVKSVFDQHMGSELWFAPIRFLGDFIADEDERDDWLSEQEQNAECYFSSVDFD
ncbi:hypothetical protein ACFOEK_06290 [Litoribrevibacter euphylliae]|uniref:DUF4375 domain-containing protein n=1 Tax=Litoribrevibacter euphylliae TaxID=1834034 RepID=A0ABV7HGG0_9GAMM